MAECGLGTPLRTLLSVCNQPLRPTQPSTLNGTENEYRLKCGDALQLGCKGRYGSYGQTCGWQVKLCDPSLTRAIPERYRDEFLMIQRYTNLRLLYFTV